MCRSVSINLGTVSTLRSSGVTESFFCKRSRQNSVYGRTLVAASSQCWKAFRSCPCTGSLLPMAGTLAEQGFPLFLFYIHEIRFGMRIFPERINPLPVVWFLPLYPTWCISQLKQSMYNFPTLPKQEPPDPELRSSAYGIERAPKSLVLNTFTKHMLP